LALARHLLERIGRDLGRPTPRLAPGAEAAIEAAPWPGNIRELANALERAAILAGDDPISAELVRAWARPGAASAAQAEPAAGPGPQTLEALERRAIERALERHGGHRRRAAEDLGIGVRTLYDKLKRYDLS